MKPNVFTCTIKCSVWARLTSCHQRSAMLSVRDSLENVVFDDNLPVDHRQAVLSHRFGCIFSREEGDGDFYRPGVALAVLHYHLQLRYVVGVYFA